MASVRKRTWRTKSGTSVAWVVDYYDADGERRSEQFDSKTEANGRRVDIESELRAGAHTALSKSPTVREAGEAWYSSKEAEKLDPHTLRSYRSMLDRHVYQHLSARKLAKLANPDIEAFKAELLEAKVSLAMTRKILTLTRMVFKHAMSRGWTRVNVAAGVSVKSDKRERKNRVAIPSKEFAAALLKRAMPEEPAPMTFAGAYVAMALFTGLRASEQRGLAWTQIQLSGPHPHIKVMQRADERGVIGPCKTEAAYRTVPIGPRLVAILRRWKLACPRSKDELVFPNGAGRPESHANLLNRLWRPLFLNLDQHGQPKRDENGKLVYAIPYFNIHAARHWYASMLIDQDEGPKRVQERMGHANIQITMDIYGHLFRDKDNERQQAAALEHAIDW